MARTNFREQQKRNIRNTTYLIIGFILFIALLGFVLGYILGGTPTGGGYGALAGVAVGGFMSWFAVMGGSESVMSIARARRITEPATAEERQLFNVTEEMAIAAGLPMPKVYIIDDLSPNAFAAGRNPEHAMVAVTRGLIEKLDRDELQAVVAHEVGHIRNYDILYTIVVTTLVGTVVMLSDFLYYSVLFGGGRSNNNENNNGQAIMMIVGLVLSIVAPLLAYMMYFAVSRQREYLADATAVELTRNPQGLEHALRKIAGDPTLLKNQSRSTAHLYILNPVKNMQGGGTNLFATHPPLADRIKKVQEMGGNAPVEGA